VIRTFFNSVVYIYNFVVHGLAVCSGIVIFGAFVLIVVDVSIRMAGFIPPRYTVPFVEYALLYFALLAAPWLVRIKGHVFIDAVRQFLPAKAQRLLAKVAYLICICSALVIFWYASELLIEGIQGGMHDVRAIDMPLWALYGPMPPIFLLVAIEFARYLVGIDDMYVDRTQVREGM
jgi:TRAP-type C4-dicarboxylate transport system permease small subunit